MIDMTKREFVKLKKGDIVLAIRHILSEEGKILIQENSEWRVEGIDLLPNRGQGRKPMKSVKVINVDNQKPYQITKDNSAFFLIYKRKRGPLPRLTT